ncbi:MAG TPA: hypothetical protein VF517_05940 [Thermoleophilaceae bacterium]|jgi:hypothetical protein
MRLFRSEEETPTDGAAMPVGRLNALAKRWYGNRLDPDWRPRTTPESQATLDAVGLTGAFWRLS